MKTIKTIQAGYSRDGSFSEGDVLKVNIEKIKLESGHTQFNVVVRDEQHNEVTRSVEGIWSRFTAKQNALILADSMAA